MSSGTLILAVILIIIGIIMIIAGAIMYEREKTTTTPTTTWILIIGGILLLIVGIGIGIYSRTDKQHTDIYSSHVDEYHHPYAHAIPTQTIPGPMYNPYAM